MINKFRVARSAGFTLVELLTVLAILAIAMGLGVPALHNFILRGRTEGFAREVSMLLQRSRLEAIKSNRDVGVFLDGDELVAFVDVDGDAQFQPDTSKPYRTVDYAIGRMKAPSAHVTFMDENGNKGPSSVVGTSTVNGTTGALFQPNGSVEEETAFRIGDVRDNFLEARIAPAATARIELRKWQGGEWIGTGDPADPDYQAWEWK